MKKIALVLYLFIVGMINLSAEELTKLSVTYEGSTTWKTNIDNALSGASQQTDLILTVTMKSGVTGFSAEDLSSFITECRKYYNGDGVTKVSVLGYDISATDLASCGSSMNLTTDFFTEIKLPSTLESLPAGAFQRGGNLTSISWGNGDKEPTEIPGWLFDGCTNLTADAIPFKMDKVQKIGAYAFSNMPLTTFDVPASCTDIDIHAFNNMNQLATFTVASGNTTFSATDGILYKGTTLFRCGMGKEGTVSLPSSTTAINDEAFSECTKLTGITLNEGISKIGREAFIGCTGITTLNIPSSVTFIHYSFVDNCSNLATFTCSDGVAYTASNGVLYRKGLIDEESGTAKDGTSDQYMLVRCPIGYKPTSYSLPTDFSGKLTYIGSYAFGQCANLQSVTLPDNVTTFATHSFNRCTALTSVDLPKSLQTWGDSPFELCSALEKVTISEDNAYFKTVNNNQFVLSKDGTTLYLVTSTFSPKSDGFFRIPRYVTTVSPCALSYCKNITTVEFPQGMTQVSLRSFYNNEYVKNIIIPHSVRALGQDFLMGTKQVSHIIFLPTTKTPLKTTEAGTGTNIDYNIFYGANSGIDFDMTAGSNYSDLADIYSKTSAKTEGVDYTGYKEFIDKGGSITANVKHIVLYEDPTDATVDPNSSDVNQNGNVANTFADGLDYATVYRKMQKSSSSETVYNSLVLPFDVTKAELADALGDETSDDDPLHDVTVYQYHGVKGTVIYFSPVNSSSWSSVDDNTIVIHKDQPVLIKVGEGWHQQDSFLFHLNGASSTEITSDKTITDGYHDSSYEANGIYNIFGTYQSKKVSTSDGDFYYVSGGKMYHMTKAGNSVSFKALRSYIVSPTGSGAKQLTMSVGGTTTAIRAIEIGNEESADSQLFTIDGRPAGKSPRRGLYVKAGKKVIID